MNNWEKDLKIYRLEQTPPKYENYQEYFDRYFAENDDTYLSWFLHHYEKELNTKAICIHRSRRKNRKLGEHKQNDANDSEATYMGILQDFSSALQIPPGFHRISHIHVAIQMEKSGDDIGICREN